jgi:hypothetical protein
MVGVLPKKVSSTWGANDADSCMFHKHAHAYHTEARCQDRDSVHKMHLQDVLEQAAASSSLKASELNGAEGMGALMPSL